ncbi:hypothetical protein IFU08_09565 [Microbacterium sp. CFBP 8790]|uniref:hypothetical protein n=1 Tax=unclassified Microbacterium TaxID=2609290 RepID=UPI0017815C24|nr:MULTISPECIES: hypothetical protein [unclassified Microbacterium]MBD8205132.1 hypothetical protein [Microbacterium sp. CFBP 8801]MBD8509813.1 hypothetical protein [Microbacterium sp. CFBP 8790]
MSTSENPETPALTRRQLRELRHTGATPIIAPETDAESSAPATDSTAETAAPAETTASSAPVVDDAAKADTPVDDASADVAAADVPAAETPAVDDAAPTALFPTAKSTDEPEPAASGADETAREDSAREDTARDDGPAAARPSAFEPPFSDHGADFGVPGLTRRQARAQEKIRTAAVPVITPDLEPALPRQNSPFAPLPQAEPTRPAIFRPSAPDTAETPAAADDAPGASVVNPALGSELLDGAKPDVTLPDSFDQLIARNASASGAVSTPNALILSQTPSGVPLVGPITATGEVMITGTFELPEGLGSVGHAPGTTDGRDADAVLLDGELPPASSPTPIAASAAISTVKQPGEIIRPPAPEKGSKLLIGLIITTGALALAVAVTLVLAFTTGVFR